MKRAPSTPRDPSRRASQAWVPAALALLLVVPASPVVLSREAALLSIPVAPVEASNHVTWGPGTAGSALAAGPMTFRASLVDAAVSLALDMYEPSITVSPTGTIYVAAHSPAINVQRSPAYYSQDNGTTWHRVAEFVNPPELAPIPGGGQGVGDEGIIVADEEGRAWLFDMFFPTGPMPLYGLCDDGERQCTFDPSARDEVANAAAPCGAGVADRPWIAYAAGKLLLVNNGFGVNEHGPVPPPNQITTAMYTRANAQIALYDPATGQSQWNMCAGRGFIPGVPALRASDGRFAVPQAQAAPGVGQRLVLIHGTDVDNPTSTPLFTGPGGSLAGCGGGGFNTGWAAYSQTGTLYVAGGAGQRRIAIAASTDDVNFPTTLFDVPAPIKFLWLSGNPRAEGALLSVGVSPGCGPGTDFYAAHVSLANGVPLVSNLSLVASGVRDACGDYMGSAVGPDGFAHVVVGSTANALCGPVNAEDPLGSTGKMPLTVYIQDGGPVL